MKRTDLIIWLAMVAISCGFIGVKNSDAKEQETVSTVEQNKEFNAYWYAGKAELTSYNISYARYGELREGKSVLVFVTEDFLLEEQVKKEHASEKPSTSILKLNKIDRFTTGIYDYSLMLSTFTPVDQGSYPYVIKTAFSAQDWCGQSFMQLNRRGSGYQSLLRSYFESEGDKASIIDDVVLEDGLWTLARLSPHLLPVGDFDILPSSANLRLNHRPLTPDRAKADLIMEVGEGGKEQFIYKVTFENGRELKMFLQTVFPYRIYGWEEKVKSGQDWLTTKATMDVTMKSSYWGENSGEFDTKRKELGLGTY